MKKELKKNWLEKLAKPQVSQKFLANFTNEPKLCTGKTLDTLFECGKVIPQKVK